MSRVSWRSIAKPLSDAVFLGALRAISSEAGVVNRFCIFLYQGLFSSFLRAPLRSRRNLLSPERPFVFEPRSPDALSPVSFIALVSPTNHLFDQHGP